MEPGRALERHRQSDARQSAKPRLRRAGTI